MMNFACIDSTILLSPEFHSLWFECNQMGLRNELPYEVTPPMVLGWAITIWMVVVEYSKNNCIAMEFHHIDSKVEFNGFAKCLEKAGWLTAIENDMVEFVAPGFFAERN